MDWLKFISLGGGFRAFKFVKLKGSLPELLLKLLLEPPPKVSVVLKLLPKGSDPLPKVSILPNAPVNGSDDVVVFVVGAKGSLVEGGADGRIDSGPKGSSLPLKGSAPKDLESSLPLKGSAPKDLGVSLPLKGSAPKDEESSLPLKGSAPKVLGTSWSLKGSAPNVLGASLPLKGSVLKEALSGPKTALSEEAKGSSLSENGSLVEMSKGSPYL